jgi:tRNA 2-thiocytidine biosynthesis protein TtcA
VKRLIDELQGEIPGIRDSMMAALGHVIPSHLMDARLFDFQSLTSKTGDVSAELDAVFEEARFGVETAR